MLATQSVPIHPRVSQAPMPPQAPPKLAPSGPRIPSMRHLKSLAALPEPPRPWRPLATTYGTQGTRGPLLPPPLDPERLPEYIRPHSSPAAEGQKKKKNKKKNSKKRLMNINHPVVCFWPPFDPFPTRSTPVLPTWSPTSDHPGPFDGTHPSHYFPRPSNVSAKPPPSSVVRLAPFRSPMPGRARTCQDVPGHARPFLAL
ncbi:hypothetical protein BKA56DRAFT_298459 [Ilyonectria sp. MPI-CAGE-AT-0026]|nr:hypothetical protein BKA56DRAFT_298459 [Ilyonectria sp. MPI-CAGE-AT-0026]